MAKIYEELNIGGSVWPSTRKHTENERVVGLARVQAHIIWQRWAGPIDQPISLGPMSCGRDDHWPVASFLAALPSYAEASYILLKLQAPRNCSGNVEDSQSCIRRSSLLLWLSLHRVYCYRGIMIDPFHETVHSSTWRICSGPRRISPPMARTHLISSPLSRYKGSVMQKLWLDRVTRCPRWRR